MPGTDTTAETTAPDAPSHETAGVELRGVTKRFGDTVAVRELDLTVAPGEFFSMLGPSGSGKTTVLRMIAGFEDVTSGSILLDGQDVTAAAPFDRTVNTVFQDYALFPHMTIAENVAYGLKVRKTAKDEIARRVGESLEQVRLSHVADRLPHQLSGGQRQRIALARALILRPRVLLLDEPLGALDKQLREQMQIELKQIQREVGITFVFVTHDQEEALTLSDRIAVFNEGRVEQVGTPREVYEYPQTAFVASFLGVSNLIPAELARELAGADGAISVRPERVRLAAVDSTRAPDETSVVGTITETVYTGPATRYIVTTEFGLTIIAERHNDHAPNDTAPYRRGDTVRVYWHREHAALVP
ncbi:putative spermidine/putrescine transport system ATP-binding protein [Microcella putealis]|uniref:Putative spermidine/putrescine transport system ATP-binding protein n=1 Tax=Microcella putealis TaxID=337005 RepID=A0A4V2EXJ9_9MICO|nr:ABC transporter ATP-binding protein [Microcella putealis]RZS59750.1 putative spermidine/putrescine transport system ATP-binding protein [Microcella putealis]TQM26863.1 putative spermidine/putrescine transport system ATP-binding protein [Microcella putealis]